MGHEIKWQILTSLRWPKHRLRSPTKEGSQEGEVSLIGTQKAVAIWLPSAPRRVCQSPSFAVRLDEHQWEMRWDVPTYLCVEELTALSCTRRRRVVFNPGYALGTARVETKGENKAIRMHTQNRYIAESCNSSRGLYATGLIQYAAMLQWALKVARLR